MITFTLGKKTVSSAKQQSISQELLAYVAQLKALFDTRRRSYAGLIAFNPGLRHKAPQRG